MGKKSLETFLNDELQIFRQSANCFITDNDMELSCGTGKVRIVEGDLIQHDVNLITCTTNKKFNGGGKPKANKALVS